MADPIAERQPHVDMAAGQTFGRYAILERLGSGGMGVVFSAYDPELDRRVALKLLRQDATAEGSKAAEHTERLDRSGNSRDLVRERLLAEGRALARLSHRNLITVFEVGAVGEQVYLAMEHVAGVSLEQWLSSDPAPSWREVLQAFVQAGRGLAAAHEAGLVHGDFKPANVVVDELSGRVCVVDFGLATAAGTRSGSSPVGTPRYMSPEQLAGRPIDPRADQFAFCVSLYEALYGEHPFAGSDPAAPAARPGIAAARPSVRKGPRRAERAILRGLSPDPAARFDAMADLLAQLDGRPSVLRRALAGAVVAGVTVLAVAMARGGSEEQCTGGPARLAGVWDPGRHALMTRVFAASGRPHAAATAARAGQQLDAYAGQWLKMYRGACLDSVRGEQSADLLDRRMACLDRRLDQMRDRTAVLIEKPEGEVIDRALTIVGDLDPLPPCADAAALLAATAPPADPGQRAAAAELEQLIDRASLDRQAGRLGAALEGARAAMTRARALAHPPIVARAAYLLGQALEDAGRPGDAEESYHEALAAAERAGDDALAAKVLVRLVFVVGRSLSRFAEGRTLARLAEASLGRAGRRADPDLRALLLNALGSVAQEEGKLDEAIAMYRESLRLRRARQPANDVQIATSENALGNTLVRKARLEEGCAHLGTALALRRKALGEEHPRTSDSYLNVGVCFFEQGRYDDARAYYLRALAIRERTPAYSTVSVHNNLGNVETVAGNYPEAIRHHEAALAERRERLGPDHPDVGTSLHNLGSIYLATGEIDRALHVLQEGMALRRRTLGESHPLFASSLVGVGEALQRSGRAREALDHHDRSIAIQTERLGRDHPQTLSARAHRAIALLDLGRAREAAAELDHLLPRLEDYKPDRALFEFALARALWATRGSKSRALELARTARAAFADSHRPEQAAEVDAWVAKRTRPARRPARAATRRR